MHHHHHHHHHEGRDVARFGAHSHSPSHMPSSVAYNTTSFLSHNHHHPQFLQTHPVRSSSVHQQLSLPLPWAANHHHQTLHLHGAVSTTSRGDNSEMRFSSENRKNINSHSAAAAGRQSPSCNPHAPLHHQRVVAAEPYSPNVQQPLPAGFVHHTMYGGDRQQILSPPSAAPSSWVSVAQQPYETSVAQQVGMQRQRASVLQSSASHFHPTDVASVVGGVALPPPPPYASPNAARSTDNNNSSGYHQSLPDPSLNHNFEEAHRLHEEPSMTGYPGSQQQQFMTTPQLHSLRTHHGSSPHHYMNHPAQVGHTLYPSRRDGASLHEHYHDGFYAPHQESSRFGNAAAQQSSPQNHLYYGPSPQHPTARNDSLRATPNPMNSIVFPPCQTQPHLLGGAPDSYMIINASSQRGGLQHATARSRGMRTPSHADTRQRHHEGSPTWGHNEPYDAAEMGSRHTTYTAEHSGGGSAFAPERYQQNMGARFDDEDSEPQADSLVSSSLASPEHGGGQRMSVKETWRARWKEKRIQLIRTMPGLIPQRIVFVDDANVCASICQQILSAMRQRGAQLSTTLSDEPMHPQAATSLDPAGAHPPVELHCFHVPSSVLTPKKKRKRGGVKRSRKSGRSSNEEAGTEEVLTRDSAQQRDSTGASTASQEGCFQAEGSITSNSTGSSSSAGSCLCHASQNLTTRHAAPDVSGPHSNRGGEAGSHADSLHPVSEGQKTTKSLCCIAVDFEGEESCLRLITIATAHAIFVILLSEDMLAPLTPLRKVLEHHRLIKVMYDCRSDVNTLRNWTGVGGSVRLAAVLDLQPMATVSFSPQGEFLSGMLKMFMHASLFASDAQKIIDDSRRIFDPERGGSYRRWEDKPLALCMQKYCALGVQQFFLAVHLMMDNIEFGFFISEHRMRNVHAGNYLRQTTNKDRDFVYTNATTYEYKPPAQVQEDHNRRRDAQQRGSGRGRGRGRGRGSR